MSGSADRARRLLALVPYLKSHPGASMAQTAEAFGVTPRQVEKDLWLLFTDCGLPGYLPGDLIDIDFGPDGIWVSEDAGLRRPVRTTPEEGLAVVVALRVLRDTADPGQRDAVDRALAKLETALAAQHHPVVAVTPPETTEHEDTVRGALREGRAVQLRYYSAGRDTVSERTVDPIRMVAIDGHWYLSAFCRRAQGVRMFRMDRIDAATALDEPAAPPPDVPTPRVPYEPRPDDMRLVLRLSPEAAWVAEYYRCDEVTDGPDGSLRVVLRMHDRSLARRLVLGLGPACQVLEPQALAAEVGEAAREALEAYR